MSLKNYELILGYLAIIEVEMDKISLACGYKDHVELLDGVKKGDVIKVVTIH